MLNKVRLFDKAAAKASSDLITANAAVAMAALSTDDSENEEVIQLTTAYSLIANDPVSQESDMYLDSGTDRDILNAHHRFTELHPIQPVRIRSANGANNLVSVQAGRVTIPTYDENNQLCHTTINNVLFCPAVAVNLISVTRLCDRGFVLTDDANCMKLVHPDGEKVFAIRTPHSMELWSARVSLTTPLSPVHSIPDTQSNSVKAFNASADLLHQRLGHLHSAAL